MSSPGLYLRCSLNSTEKPWKGRETGQLKSALTRPLTAAVERVVAFEIDRDLASELRVNAPPNLAIVEGDFEPFVVHYAETFVVPAAAVAAMGRDPISPASKSSRNRTNTGARRCPSSVQPW